MSYCNLGIICNESDRKKASTVYLSKTVPIAKKAGLWWYLENSEQLLSEINNK